jgi:glutamate N-acetyltransferase/amino-acid N-acetyltransferase
MIVRDGEGATKLVSVTVRGAKTAAEALAAARTVANSPLVKTAFYGQDPNWGRIMGALGRSGITMEEARVDISINDVPIVFGGLAKGVEWEKKAAEKMKEKEFQVIIDLHQGDHEDEMITCDFTHDYVSINADYRT